MRIDLSSERFVENRLIETRGTYDVEPSVSPDGRWIAFSTSRGGNREIYLTNPRGSVVVDLTKNHDDSEPAWSPDETQIAFASDRGGRNSQIYVMRRDGSHVTRVTDDSATDLHPTWSPDGTTIAFASASIGADGRRAPSQIKLLDLASGRTTFITSQGSNFAPAWSPDGTQIAFVSRRDGNREIYLVSVEGDNPQQRLTRDRRSDYAPSWSQDGQWIVFVSKRKGTPRISG